MDGSPLKLTPSEVALYYRTHVPGLEPGRDKYAGLWCGSCPVCRGQDPHDFTGIPETGVYYCYARCRVGGDIYSLDLALYGGSPSESRARIFHAVGRPIQWLTKKQKKEIVAKCQRDQEDMLLAEHWHRGSLLTIEQQLETDKRWLFQSEGETHERLARAVRSNTLREQRLRAFTRSELLKAYREENAADPVLASLMVRLGKDDRDDIRLLAASLVRLIEIQSAKERELVA